MQWYFKTGGVVSAKNSTDGGA